MLLEAKMKKPPTFKYRRRITLRPSLGNLPMLRMLQRSRARDWTRNSVFKSRDLSSSYPSCGWTELSNALVLIIWDSRPWENPTKDNNSSWMIRLRPLKTTNGKVDLSLFRATEDLPTCTRLPPMPDGSNSSDGKVTCWSTRKERSWPSRVTLIEKTETLESTTRTVKLVRHGTSSTSMKCQMISKLVIWTRTGV